MSCADTFRPNSDSEAWNKCSATPINTYVKSIDIDASAGAIETDLQKHPPRLETDLTIELTCNIEVECENLSAELDVSEQIVRRGGARDKYE